jgi:malate dehydrogenase (oxaloacetate-decarboxylating)(NADP+)
LKPAIKHFYAMNMRLPRTVYLRYLCEPRSDRRANRRDDFLAAEEIRRFGITPKAALLSHSNFGTSDVSARKCAARWAHHKSHARPRSQEKCMAALRNHTNGLLSQFPPEGRCGFTYHADTGCSEHWFQLTQNRRRQGITVGPIALGCAKPVHIVTPTATVRRIVNMTALTVVDAQLQQ